MAIHAAVQPLSPHKLLPQDPMVMKKKLNAEDGPAECKVILGWLFDFSCPTQEQILGIDREYETYASLWQDQRQMPQIDNLATDAFVNGHSTSPPFPQLSLQITVESKTTALDHYLASLYGRLTADENIPYPSLERSQTQPPGSLQTKHVYYSDSCPFGLGGYTVARFAWRFHMSSKL